MIPNSKKKKKKGKKWQKTKGNELVLWYNYKGFMINNKKALIIILILSSEKKTHIHIVTW